MQLNPLGDRIVATKEKPMEKTASGLLLGEAKEKPVYATVTAVGPDVKSIKKGDKILYKDYSATEITIDKSDYLIIKEEDILAKIA